MSSARPRFPLFDVAEPRIRLLHFTWLAFSSRSSSGSRMAGAYGNVGGVLFLTVLSFVSRQLFFVSIAGVSALAFVAACFLDEPQGFMVEVDVHGVTHKIPVE